MKTHDDQPWQAYILTPTMQFKWFRVLRENATPVIVTQCSPYYDDPDFYELRQAFSRADGKTRWKAVEVATDAEQQEETLP